MAAQAMNTQPVPDPAPRVPKRGLGWLSVLLLLILVGGLAAAGGWYLAKTDYDKRHAAMQKEMDDLSAQVKKANEKTLVITQWNIKGVVGASLGETTYTYRSKSSTDPEAVHFGSKLQSSIPISCAPTDRWGIARLAPDDILPSPAGDGVTKVKDAKSSGLKQVGGFYFMRLYPQMSDCPDKGDHDKTLKLDQAYAALYDSLEEVK